MAEKQTPNPDINQTTKPPKKSFWLPLLVAILTALVVGSGVYVLESNTASQEKATLQKEVDSLKDELNSLKKKDASKNSEDEAVSRK